MASDAKNAGPYRASQSGINYWINKDGENTLGAVYAGSDEQSASLWVKHLNAAYAAGRASADAEVERMRGALEKIADAPANGPGGELYYEVTDPETGQTGTMHVDPIGWIGDAANKARYALAGGGAG